VNFTRPTLPDNKPVREETKSILARRTGGLTAGEGQSMGRATTIGMNFVGCVLAGAGLGWVADRFLIRNPQMLWGTAIGVLFGLFTGVVSMIRLSNAINEADSKRRDGDG
jgi:ATP synthase protein I